MTAFWDIVPFSLSEVESPDDAPLKHQSISTTLHGTTSQKAVIFILAAMRT
jgi:hypothetical protein